MYITDMELTMTKLQALADDISLERAIKDLVNEHDIKHMDEGENYYHNENDEIMSKSRYYYDENKEKQTDETKPNRKIPHNWHKILVDQKTSYLVGDPPNMTADNDSFTDKLNEMLDEDFHDDLQELSKEASNKGVSWLHVYIDEVEEGIGELKYTIIPSQEIIPVWDSQYQKELQAVIRYYIIWQGRKERKRVEYWTTEGVTYYLEADTGEFVPDMEDNQVDEEGNIQPIPHIEYRGEQTGWGRVPFIPFKNNEEMKNDLNYYKALIDEYDFTQSNHGDKMVEVQDIVWVLKNYEGTSLAGFVEKLRYFRAMKTDGDGGAEAKTFEIPHEAKETHLNRVQDDLFLFGQGVNMKTDVLGNSPSGVALKFMYSLLDLKANVMARKFNRALKEFMWLVKEYLYMAGEGDYKSEKVKVSFNKSKIMNELEQVQMAQMSKGITSDDTVLEMHPHVQDVQAEQEKIDEMREEMVNLQDLEPQEEEE